ncbi:hypothetical protein [Rhodococcus pyridinivorans]|uniref:hypothetical protein n=1 Tax=Rhodococcus pyridinivorans TaxID=103816 RepID=UPI000BA2183D|nr:hypothetical protein [Rhodococcus pyridinivorans]
MTAPAVNPDASRIWDEAEVYVLARSAVPGGNIAPFIPATVDDEPHEAWEFVGLLDAAAGIPVNPEMEIVHYDAFGHSRYRSKARKGTVSTGFTALEDNSVTRKFVLPGSTAKKIGAPRGVYFYTMYVLRDEDIITDIWVSLRPALFELGSFTKAEGEQEMYAITVHHANDPNRDVFERVETIEGETTWSVTISGTPTGGTWTATVNGQTTTGIAHNATAATVQTAVNALSTVDGATVTGSAGGPYTITLPGGGALTVSGTGLTGGTNPAAAAVPA